MDKKSLSLVTNVEIIKVAFVLKMSYE